MGNPDMPTPKHIVDKLIEAARNPRNHRYSVTRGIPKLRNAISDWYGRKFGVSIDPESEAMVTMGAKEGIGHLVLATVHTGEVVFVPDPTYPIHTYSVVIAGGDLRTIPLLPLDGFIERLSVAVKTTWPQPRMLILSFPNNPTTEVVTIDFFERIVDFAKEHELMVVHDLAYADLTFDGYVAPSFLQVKGAKDVGVEFFSLSKSYSMPGWRVGFAVGNRKMIAALTRLKSYFDYGVFQPVQIASIIALNEENAVRARRSPGNTGREGTPSAGGLTRCGWHVPAAERDHVRLGADPRTVRVHGVRGVLEAAAAGSEGGQLAGHRFWRVRRRLRQVCPHRERAQDQTGREGHPERAGRKKAMIRVGIIGLGTVGRGTYRILREHRALIAQKTGLDIALAGAAEIDAERRNGLAQERPALFSQRIGAYRRSCNRYHCRVDRGHGVCL